MFQEDDRRLASCERTQRSVRTFLFLLMRVSHVFPADERPKREMGGDCGVVAPTRSDPNVGRRGAAG